MAWLLKWFLGGGWLWAIGAAALVAGYLYITNLQHEAAKVPVLQEAVKGRDALITQMKAADKDRLKVDELLSKWGLDKNAIMQAIRASTRNAPIQTNPVCFPSADDRRLRNDAFDKLLPAPAVPAQ